jgi:hypothetical protein
VQQSSVGPYYVLVTNPLGWATSSVATLSLLTRPYLGAPQASGNVFQFVLSGNTGLTYLVEASTNLLDWSVLGTLTNVNGQELFSDPLGSNYFNRFYRARLLP